MINLVEFSIPLDLSQSPQNIEFLDWCEGRFTEKKKKKKEYLTF